PAEPPFDGDRLALDVSMVAHSLQERRDPRAGLGIETQIPDPWHRGARLSACNPSSSPGQEECSAEDSPPIHPYRIKLTVPNDANSIASRIASRDLIFSAPPWRSRV